MCGSIILHTISPVVVLVSAMTFVSSVISATIEPNLWASDLAKLMERISGPLQGCLEASTMSIVVALETLIPIVESDMDVSLIEAQQIKAVRRLNSSSAHTTQRETQSTQKSSPMGEGWLSLLKWFPPLNLSKVGLFKGSDVVLSDYSLPVQHLHQGVPPGLRLSDSYTRGFDIVLSDYSLPG
jgi:hypothetical protein